MIEIDLEELIKKTILQEMILSSQAANMPESFIKNIKIKKVSDGTYEIENAWKSKKDEKPLAIFFEYGTQDHWIQGNPILAFPSRGPESGSAKAIYSKNFHTKKGDTIFSTGHYVAGLPAYEPMTNGFRKGIQKMREMLEQQ